MIAETIKFLMINFTLTLFILGLVASGLRLLRTPKPASPSAVTGALLDYFILFSIGISFLYNFVVHSVFGEYSAHIIGWAQSPFQLEVAFASLGFALVGFLAFPRTAGIGVKFAAVLGITPFLWGAAGGHIVQIIQTGNMSTGNAGIILYTDLLLPAIGLALVWSHHATTRRVTPRSAAASAAAQQTPKSDPTARLS
jgi:hypothetical protein